MRGGALDKSRYQNAPRSRFGDIRAGSSPTTFPAAFRHRNSFRDRLRDRRLCTPRARCGFCMRRRHRSHETAEISFRYVANVFEIMQRFAHRVESQPAMAPITKATIRDVSMIFPPIRFDDSSLTRVPSHRHGDRGHCFARQRFYEDLLGWPFVGWKRPRNGTTVRPAWGALPP